MRYLRRDGTVIVGLSKEKHHIKITVEDNGIGIRMRIYPISLKDFIGLIVLGIRRLEEGLGLSIVRNLVEAHGELFMWKVKLVKALSLHSYSL